MLKKHILPRDDQRVKRVHVSITRQIFPDYRV